MEKSSLEVHFNLKYFKGFWGGGKWGEIILSKNCDFELNFSNQFLLHCHNLKQILL